VTKAGVASHVRDNELRKIGVALYFAEFTGLSIKEAAKRIGNHKSVNRSPFTVAKWLYEEKRKQKKQT
jgi:transposase